MLGQQALRGACLWSVRGGRLQPVVGPMLAEGDGVVSVSALVCAEQVVELPAIGVGALLLRGGRERERREA